MNVSNRRSRVVAGLVLLTLCLLLSLLAGWVQANVFTFERPPRVHEIGLADLTGNGYLDAYLAIGHGSGEPYIHPDYVLFNEGDGRFVDSGQDLANWNSFSVRLADVNGDGHKDAVVGHSGAVLIQLNNGHGFFDGDGFTTAGVSPGTFRLAVDLADLNGNGSPDIFGAACCGGGTGQPPRRPYFSEDRVWRNNGSGRFILHGTSLAATGSNGVALGDLNGSGFADAFIAGGQSTNDDRSTTSKTPNTIWFNDGDGRFSDSGQQLGQRESMAVALGDLNGNGFLDAVVGNRGADEIWFNDGTGLFSDSGQRLGRGLTQAVFLADLNGNGRLDLITAGERNARVWLNDGTGRFSAGQQI
ncbi:MAG: VCBS repeat-containing protein, partial [Chloroflexota bacterium]